jgi:hypothetical protein
MTLLIISSLFAGCVGKTSSTVTNANATSNQADTPTANSANSGATAGTGPQNQGIGGNTSDGVVNHNTYTVPPGFNKNGDTGSATRNGNTAP